MFIKRTDLALEARELWQESAELRLYLGLSDSFQAGGLDKSRLLSSGLPGAACRSLLDRKSVV